ncbi:MAG: hypothetical protein CME65_15730 [Halobacteriovoraceae bacterium]|nr:hypothetical protein [Halobacteriovoraceae bacterium]|tara:strand:- start:57132 stop:57554 length:423 start_codon:yes stop_codon:yes gene_type:complete
MSLKKCPFCSEEIQADAKKCKHCHEYLYSPSKTEIELTIPKQYYGLRTLGAFGGSIMVISGIVMCFSIIGILPGLGLIAIGITTTCYSAGVRTVVCSNCSRENKVIAPLPLIHSKDEHKTSVKCKRCKELIYIKWASIQN